MSQQKMSKAAHLRKRRPSTELTRSNICSKCGKAYEEFRTMQQHMMQKHGIRVSLRDKDEHGRVIERPLPRTLRKGVKVDALVRTKPVGYTSPAMSSTSESDFSDDENEPDNPPRPQETQPVTPATAPLADIDIDVPSDADSWQPLELRLDEAEELAETAMNLWGELSFARMAGDLLYSEDEVGRMFDEIQKTGEAISALSSSGMVGVPDRIHAV